MPSPIVLLHFDEPAGANPTDSLGNLAQLAVEPGIVAPVVASAWTGAARRFRQADTNALIAADLSANGTMLPRDVTIQALIAFTLTGASGPQTIYTRGVDDGSAPERYAYGLEVEEQAINPGHLEVRWFWQDSAGTIITAPPGVFKHAGDGAEIMLTATRRWESKSRVVVRYYIDRRMIAELVTTSGDISGGVSGSTSVGARKAAGTWDRFLNADVDELLVADYEMSADEIAQTFDRLAVHQPAGLAMLRGLAPPGVWWFDNPGNGIGRRMKVIGQALGLPLSAIASMRATFLPDRCPVWLLVRWEALYTIIPKPLDSLDMRRARVIARMSADEGFSIPALQQAFSGVLALDAAEVEILEYTNEIRDGFDTLEAERWSEGSIGTWSIDTGRLKLTVPSGTAVPVDVAPNPCHLWTPLDRQDGSAFLQAKIVDYAALPVGAFVGLMMHARVGSRTLWFGVYNNAGTIELGTREVDFGGDSFGAWAPIVAMPAGPVWLRLQIAPDASLGLWYSTSGANSGFTFYGSAAWPDYDLAGFGAFTTATPGVDIVARFDDFVGFTPEGLVPFVWFAYRDPSLPGSPDMIGANALARKVSPAHMYAAACSSKSLILDDPTCLLDTTPMGS